MEARRLRGNHRDGMDVYAMGSMWGEHRVGIFQTYLCIIRPFVNAYVLSIYKYLDTEVSHSLLSYIEGVVRGIYERRLSMVAKNYVQRNFSAWNP